MRLRAAAVLGIAAITALALPGCSTNSSQGQPSSPASARPESAASAPESAPLSSAALQEFLLDESDLGSGYTRKPEQLAHHDDVTVIGCPVLDELGGDAATGGSLDFPRKAEASFTYAGSSSAEVSEELYSDTAGKLSQGTGRVFDAMTACPAYQVVAGSTAIDVATQKMPAPQVGDEQWSLLLTFSVGGQDSVVKQIAIRTGTVLLIISGSPALVDRHLDAAVAKAMAAH